MISTYRKHTIKKLSIIWAVAGNLYNQVRQKPLSDSTFGGQWREIENITFPHDYKFPKNDIAILVSIN